MVSIGQVWLGEICAEREGNYVYEVHLVCLFFTVVVIQNWLTSAPDPTLTIGYSHYNDTMNSLVPTMTLR